MKQLVGINNISVSQLEDVWYIADISSVEDGCKNSLCFYREDGSKISELPEVTFNPELNQLIVDAAFSVTDDVVLYGNVLFKGTTHLPKNQVIESPSLTGLVNINAITVFDGIRTLFTKHVTFTDSVKVTGKLNLTERTIHSRIGSVNDKKGDVAIDSNYLYYCTSDYDGTSNIWVRWASDSQW